MRIASSARLLGSSADLTLLSDILHDVCFGGCYQMFLEQPLLQQSNRLDVSFVITVFRLCFVTSLVFLAYCVNSIHKLFLCRLREG